MIWFMLFYITVSPLYVIQWGCQ